MLAESIDRYIKRRRCGNCDLCNAKVKSNHSAVSYYYENLFVIRLVAVYCGSRVHFNAREKRTFYRIAISATY
jgi:hypothetical protein